MKPLYRDDGMKGARWVHDGRTEKDYLRLIYLYVAWAFWLSIAGGVILVIAVASASS